MIKLLVDSSADLSAEALARMGAVSVPLGVTIQGGDYLDGVDLSRDRFYEMLTDASEFPKTTMPSPAAFVEHFERAKNSGDQLICILLSSALSGTYQSAVTAKAMVDYDGIFIVDSLAAASCIRILAEHAERLITDGHTAGEIVLSLEQLKGRVHVYAALDTLEYLYKGGRLSRAAAAVGTIANLKPIVTFDGNGSVVVCKKSLSRARARTDLMEIIRSKNIDPAFPVYSLYTSGTENVEYLEQQIADAGINLTERTQIGPAIGSHVGPGVYGLFIVERES
ncbi:MAG: DegV family protein [Ruminococcaceae bacterium]|nr:DegV family protein [Oscillospiraceae bacterium]